MLSEKKITLLVVPRDGSLLKTYSFSKVWMWVLSLAGIMLTIGLSAWALYNHYQVKAMAAQVAVTDRLRQEAVQQNVQLCAFADKVRVLEQEMAQLRQFDRKLRAMTGKTSLNSKTPLTTTGGSDRDAVNPTTTLKGNTESLVRQMHRDLDRLLAEASVREFSQQELGAFIEDSKSLMASMPDIWPVHGPVTSTFGYRGGGAGSEFHRGLDIIAPVGTPILAPADGIVVSTEWTSGYGLIMAINHGYGLVTRYAHLSQAYVEEGQRIRRGEKVAAVGMTGRTSGSHLHYEVIHNGIPVNPFGYLEAKK